MDGGDGLASVELDEEQQEAVKAFAVRTASDPDSDPETGAESGEVEHESRNPPADGSGLSEPTLLREPMAPSYRLLGAGALVAAGYMDPGNWTTAMQDGVAHGHSSLWVVLSASLVAMLLQWVAGRVGAVTGRGLAELCRDELPRACVILLISAEN